MKWRASGVTHRQRILFIFLCLVASGWGIFTLWNRRAMSVQKTDTAPGPEMLLSEEVSDSKLGKGRTPDETRRSDQKSSKQSAESKFPREQSFYDKDRSLRRGGAVYEWIGIHGARPMIQLVNENGFDKSNSQKWFADSLVVSTKLPEQQDSLSNALKEYGVTRVESLGNDSTWQVTISPQNAKEYLELFDRIKTSHKIASIGRDKIIRASRLPNDPLLAMQYGVGGVNTTASVKADLAWNSKRDCSSVRVAIIDSGIDKNHPDLTANINTELSQNFVSNSILASECETDAVPNDPIPLIDRLRYEDEYGHGTHVAGIIGAVGDNSIGVSGICWKAQIIVLRVFSKCRSTNTATFLAAINSAARIPNIRVVNMSLGAPLDEGELEKNSPTSRSLENLSRAGALIVAASGNEGKDLGIEPVMPASIDNPSIIAVASHNANNEISTFSNYNSNSVDIAAPGEFILSSYPTSMATETASDIRNNPSNFSFSNEFERSLTYLPATGYEFLDGTSMAAPFVSGAVALLWSLDTSKSSAEIKNIILETADIESRFVAKVQNGRRLNLGRGISAMLGYIAKINGTDALVKSDASISRGTQIFLDLEKFSTLPLNGAKILLGPTEIGQCFDGDKTCVGRVPAENQINTKSVSHPLKIVRNDSEFPLGTLRLMSLNEQNTLFKRDNLSRSCRVMTDNMPISVFYTNNFTTCKNICRMLLSGAKKFTGSCEFGEQKETIQSEACNANAK